MEYVAKLEKAIFQKLLKTQSHFQDQYFLFLEGKNVKSVEGKYVMVKRFLNQSFLNPKVVSNKTKLLQILNAFYNDQYASKKVKNLASVCQNAIRFKVSYFKKGTYFHKVLMVSKFPKYANEAR